jgi:hypothetical protein
MDEEERYVVEEIPEFGVSFERPDFWEFRHERRKDGDTYVYWDEYTGTLRITPSRPAGTRFVADEFLERHFEEVRERKPVWRTFGGRRFVCYVEDKPETDTRLHYFIGAYDQTLLVCSFAYALEPLEDEFYADEVAGALEDVAHVFASMKLD